MYENQAGAQTLTLENRKHITLSGVKSVDSFSPQGMKLTTDGGKVNILGENLKVLSFSKQSGAFSAEGRVDGIRFSGAKTGLMKKVFR